MVNFSWTKRGPYKRDLLHLIIDGCKTNLVVALGIFPRVPAELEDCDDDSEAESAEQHHEHAADVLHAQGIRFRVLALVLT